MPGRIFQKPLAKCPFCKLTGTLLGLPAHVRKEHGDEPMPQWRKLGEDRWSIDTGSNHQPAADVAPITDNPKAPPFWWFITPPIGRTYQSRTIIRSGLSHSVDSAKETAYQNWLPFWAPVKNTHPHSSADRAVDP